MSPVSVHAVLTPRPEHLAEVEAELRVMARASRQEEGNLRYDLTRERTESGVRLHISERYRDEAAVQAHRASAHYQAYRAKAAHWLAEPPQVSVMEEVDVAG
ncbi:putative quinol monooxygenase [Deinococcus wulumuqiensis]|uniref:putative quinol monooxygenase n=1 Tax=Deinococcus wulumuqiensis TaxID=980427 RepID=UPI00242B51EB|nr:putative quinol monooxygenase [Deinococcus wulumuqiensis]